MLELEISFITRAAYNPEELMTSGQRAFVCKKCGRRHTYYRVPPLTCENAKCQVKLPNLKMIQNKYLRVAYHFCAENEESTIWEAVSGMC